MIAALRALSPSELHRLLPIAAVGRSLAAVGADDEAVVVSQEGLRIREAQREASREQERMQREHFQNQMMRLEKQVGGGGDGGAA